MSEIAALFSNVGNITLPEVVMWIIGGVLIYLGIRKKMEPSLLVPMGFGAILVNLPMSAAVTQKVAGVIEEGPLDILFNAGIGNELFLLLLFIGIGAMIDFTPLLESPVLMLLGAAAQFGIFMTLSLATLFGFSLQDAASVGIIGAADSPTSTRRAILSTTNILCRSSLDTRSLRAGQRLSSTRWASLSTRIIRSFSTCHAA